MSFKEILEELSAIGKLFGDSVKPVPVNLPPNRLPTFKAGLEKKRTSADAKVAALLEHYKGLESEVYIQQIIQDIQRHYNISPKDTTRLIEYPFNADAQKWGAHYTHECYEQLMSYCKLAYFEEKNGVPEEHALKLAVLFSGVFPALSYIAGSSGDNKLAIHDALLFALPDPRECDFTTWKELANARGNMQDKAFRDLLARAPDIENEIKLNKPKPGAGKPNSTVLKDKKTEIKSANIDYKKLKMKHGELNGTEEERYVFLIKLLPKLAIELFNLSAGIELSNCDAAILKAADEAFKQRTLGAYKIMLEHGLTSKDFAKFTGLKRQNSDIHIPNIKIDGAELGFLGINLTKVNVLDESQAAEAACFGKLTNCCQSLSGEVGEPCVIHGLTSPYGGFYVVKNERGDVLGQCWAWRSQEEAIVFDSIEIAKGVESNQPVIALFNKLAHEMVDKKFTHKVACGESSGISRNFGILSPFIHEYFVDYDSYCDSESQRVIVDSRRPYLFYNVDDKAKEQTKNLIEVMMKSGDLERNLYFIEMINIMILSRDDELKHEIERASKVWGVDQQVLEIIENIKEFTSGYLNSNLSTLYNTLDKAPYLARVSNRDQSTALLRAAEEGYIDLALKLLENGAKIGHKNRDGSTALMRATSKGHVDLGFKLIEMGSMIDEKDNRGCTPLIYAAMYGCVKLGFKFIEMGAKLDEKDMYGYTALIYAAEKGNKELALKLIENKANINDKTAGGSTALIKAAKNGHSKIGCALIENGAKLDNDLDSFTPLMIAAAIGHSELTLKLIKNSRIDDKDRDGLTALLYAAKYGHSEVARILIESGAEINEKDRYGYTPLIYAADIGNSELTQLLIQESAKLNEKDGTGNTPLMHAARNGHLETLRILIEGGASIDDKNREGDTALMCAAKKNKSEIALKLLEMGANYDAKNNRGFSVWRLTILSGHRELADLMKVKAEEVKASQCKQKKSKISILDKENKNNDSSQSSVVPDVSIEETNKRPKP